MLNAHTSGEQTPKPAFLKGLLWIIFSAAATFCAIFLPVHIFAILKGGDPKLGNSYLLGNYYNNFYLRAYVFILLSCALFHSIYRINTILLDLGLAKYQKTAGVLLSLLFVTFEIITFYVFF